MTKYTKESVEMHGDGWNNRNRQPAINVKCYDFPSVYKIADHYGKDAESPEVEKVMEWLFESFQQSFWEDAQNDAEEIFGSRVKVHSAGRSGGWLIVDGLKDFDDWDAIDLAKWRKFERWMKGSIPTDNAEWLSAMIDTIDANEWFLKPEDETEKELEAALSGLTEV